jgi:hypothetical protein
MSCDRAVTIFLLTLYVSLFFCSPAEAARRPHINIDTRAYDAKLAMRKSQLGREKIFKFNDVSLGVDKVNHTPPAGAPPPKVVYGINKHKTKPPILGSTCKHEMYEELFKPYFAIDYTELAVRDNEHSKIEDTLYLEGDDALAWYVHPYSPCYISIHECLS